jgi:hypothetical protein
MLVTENRGTKRAMYSKYNSLGLEVSTEARTMRQLKHFVRDHQKRSWFDNGRHTTWHCCINHHKSDAIVSARCEETY